MAKLKKSWVTDCPACGNALVVDPETHEVVAHAAEKPGGNGGGKGGGDNGSDPPEEQNPPSNDGGNGADSDEQNPWNW